MPDEVSDAKGRQPLVLEIPGAAPMELTDWYEGFADIYPHSELESKRWCARHVGPDWTIIDVGANVGCYSILFSRLAHAGRVYAFEPTSTCAMLQNNLAHNGIQNCVVVKNALGQCNGIKEDAIFRIWGNEAEIMPYNFITLDAFVKENNIERIDLIKIDVDSFELEVVRGGENIITVFDPFILIEINPEALNRRCHAPEDIFNWFKERGYNYAQQFDKENYLLKRNGYNYPMQDRNTLIRLAWPASIL